MCLFCDRERGKQEPADRVTDGLRWSCGRLGCGLLDSRADAGHVAVDVVVAVPREVAVVVAFGNVRQVGVDDLPLAVRRIDFHCDAVELGLPESDDRICARGVASLARRIAGAFAYLSPELSKASIRCRISDGRPPTRAGGRAGAASA